MYRNRFSLDWLFSFAEFSRQILRDKNYFFAPHSVEITLYPHSIEKWCKFYLLNVDHDVFLS